MEQRHGCGAGRRPAFPGEGGDGGGHAAARRGMKRGVWVEDALPFVRRRRGCGHAMRGRPLVTRASLPRRVFRRAGLIKVVPLATVLGSQDVLRPWSFWKDSRRCTAAPLSPRHAGYSGHNEQPLRVPFFGALR